MIQRLKAYPAYRDSGVPVIGTIPAHWDVRQLGRFGRLSKGSGGTKEDEVANGVACVRYGDIYTSHQFFVRQSRSCVAVERAGEYTPIEYGDVLFAGSGETIEEIGKSVVNLIDDAACCGGDVIVFRPHIDLDAHFMGYASDCSQARLQKSRMGRGITVMHLYGDQLKQLWVPLPPLEEQVAIAKWLDSVDRRIRRYIRAKWRLISLLEEERRGIINEAVIRGLDPGVRLRSSGVDWLGEVPAHWDVRLLGRCLRRIDQGWSPLAAEGIRTEGQWAVLTLSSVRRGTFDPAAIKPVPACAEIPRGIEIRDGDLLLTRSNTRELVGDTCLVEGSTPRTLICDLIYRLVPESSQLFGGFLMLQLLSLVGRNQIERDARGSSNTMPKIAQRHVRSWQVLVPPLEEQAQIIEFVRDATRAVGETIERARTEISQLSEYRTRLIADVATGGLDVRAAAAALPEEADLSGENDLMDSVEELPPDGDVDDECEAARDAE